MTTLARPERRGVEVAAEDDAVDVTGHRALELAPVPGVQSSLSHRQSLAN